MSQYRRWLVLFSRDTTRNAYIYQCLMILEQREDAMERNIITYNYRFIADMAELRPINRITRSMRRVCFALRNHIVLLRARAMILRMADRGGNTRRAVHECRRQEREDLEMLRTMVRRLRRLNEIERN